VFYGSSALTTLLIFAAQDRDISGISALDLARFPQRTQCILSMKFNREYRAHVAEKEIPGCAFQSVRDRWYEVLTETDELYLAWDRLDWCHFQAASHMPYDPEKRRLRQQLLRLRNVIGKEAYDIGQMPPPAPTWRFSWRE
jgi:hypothetical protein